MKKPRTYPPGTLVKVRLFYDERAAYDPINGPFDLKLPVAHGYGKTTEHQHPDPRHAEEICVAFAAPPDPKPYHVWFRPNSVRKLPASNNTRRFITAVGRKGVGGVAVDFIACYEVELLGDGKQERTLRHPKGFYTFQTHVGLDYGHATREEANTAFHEARYREIEDWKKKIAEAERELTTEIENVDLEPLP